MIGMRAVSEVSTVRYRRAYSIAQRHRRLVGLIRSGRLSTPALAAKLGVSEPTIYRDIASLKDRGREVRSVKRGRRWGYQIAAKSPTIDLDTGPS